MFKIDLYPEEKIVLELRRHWFIFFLETIFLVILACLPFVVLFIFGQTEWWQKYPTLSDWFGLGVSVWFLFLWVTFFVLWTNFYLDAWIITNRRIIDIEQYGLFNREISEFRMEKIQDISVEIGGFIPTILNYGDILIETAADKKQCRIKDAPHPEKVKNLISGLQTDLTHKQSNTIDK